MSERVLLSLRFPSDSRLCSISVIVFFFIAGRRTWKNGCEEYVIVGMKGPGGALQ